MCHYDYWIVYLKTSQYSSKQDITSFGSRRFASKEEAQAHKFVDIFAEAWHHPEHEWLLPNSQVAQGFDVTEAAVRHYTYRKPQQIQEGKHWIRDQAGKVWWTKKGVLQLSQLISSPCAQALYEAAVDFELDVLVEPKAEDSDASEAPEIDLPTPLLESIASEMALSFVEKLIVEMANNIERMTVRPTVDEIYRISSAFAKLELVAQGLVMTAEAPQTTINKAIHEQTNI